MVSSDDSVDFDSASTDDVDRLFRGSCVSQDFTYDDDEWEASIATMRTRSGHGCPGHFLSVYRPESWGWFSFQLSGSRFSRHFLFLRALCLLGQYSAPPLVGYFQFGN